MLLDFINGILYGQGTDSIQEIRLHDISLFVQCVRHPGKVFPCRAQEQGCLSGFFYIPAHLASKVQRCISNLHDSFFYIQVPNVNYFIAAGNPGIEI
jgi:hypothetical protein